MKSCCALAVLTFPGVVLAATVLTEPCDFSTYDPAGETEFQIRVPTSVETPFTLSTDLNWPGKSFRVDQGKRFIFDLQDHALTIGTLFRNEAKNDELLFKDGSITGGSGSWLRMAYWGDTDVSGSRLVFDNVDYTASGSSYYQGPVGGNTFFALTNGSTFSVGCVQNFFKSTNSAHTNNLVLISNGSKFYSPSLTFSLSTTNVFLNNRIVVTGQDSFFGPASVSYAPFAIGRASGEIGTCGGTLEVSDKATAYFGNMCIGEGALACSNTVTVRSGATIQLQQSLTLGKGVGANGNRFEVLNANHARKTSTDSDYVGYYGCYNEYVISNSVVKPMYYILCGVYPGANHNACRIYGQKTEMAGANMVFRLFGTGEYNEWEFNDCTVSNESLRVNLANDGGASVGTTNNTLKVQNGAVLVGYDVFVSRACASNTIFVGNNAELRGCHDVHIRGLDNRLVISNGLMRISQSGENLRFGTTGTVESVFLETGNTLVLQGRHPRLRSETDLAGRTFKMSDQSLLQFDLPSDGYDDVLFNDVSAHLDWDTTVRFTGIEAFQKSLAHGTDVVLGVNSEFSIRDLPEGKTVTDFLKKVEGLPEGCYLKHVSKRVDKYDRNVNHLVLHVSSGRGLLLLLR